MDANTRTVERTAWFSIAVNVFLIVLNLAIATFSGSLAVAAEMVHNLVDFVAAIALMAGLKLSQRKSKAFPYGLYKIENVIAVIMALLIFFTGYEIINEALFAPPRELTINPAMLGGIIISIVLPLVFSRYEMRIGRAANSPSLIADAQEYRVHLFSSGLVLLAFFGQMVGLSLDRWAALLVVVFIGKTGWDLLRDGMRVLLDASLDAETLGKVRHILQQDPLLVSVKTLTGRNAGRYRFIEAEVFLRTQDLTLAHTASERLEARIKTEVPHVDRVLIHYEPVSRTHIRYGVPLADPAGDVSAHFGSAPYFALLTIRSADGRLEHQEIQPNPYLDVAKAKGIRVAEWLAAKKTDVVLLPASPLMTLQNKGPGYVFGNAGIEMRQTNVATLDEVLAEVTQASSRRR